MGEKVRLGLPLQPISAAVYAAAELGYFAKEGIDVELVEFSTGKEALAKLFTGQLEFAVAAETPLVHASLAGEEYAILATIGQSSTALAFVGRKDRGIDDFKRVKGKRIGVMLGTNGEYFFETFRVLNGLDSADVEIKDIPSEKLAAALLNGEVDGTCIWEPHLSQIKDKLGSSGYYFDGKGMYKWSWNLVATRSYLEGHTEVVEKILRALVHSGEQIEGDSRIAASILEKRKLSIAQKRLTELLIDYDFKPQLSQELILQMEAQSRWISSRGAERKMPNYLRYVETGPLKRISPRAVTVIE
jgi:NitT/TauT family transport system substrate-binding protein